MSGFYDLRSELLKKYNIDQQQEKGTSYSNYTYDDGEDFYSFRQKLLDKYSEENVRQRQKNITDWINRYNTIVKGFGQEDAVKNGFYTRQTIDQYGKELDSLVSGYEDVKDYIGRMGVPNAAQLVSNLRKLQSEVHREDSWYQSRKGNDYFSIRDELDTMDSGSDEYRWLTDYAQSVIRPEDYEKMILENEGSLQYLENALQEIRGVSEQINLGGEDPATVKRYKALTQKYGSTSELEARIEALNAENWNYRKAVEYDFLDENEDYGEMSSKVSNQRTAGFGIGWGTSWLGQGDPVYDYINNIDGARETHPAQKGKTPYSIYDYMTDKEIADYNYLYNTQGQDAAHGYLDYLGYTLDQRRMEQLQENTAEYAREHPLAASALSVTTNLVSGMGILDVASQNATRQMSGEYKPINYNSVGMVPTVVTTATRCAISQKITDTTGTIKLDTEEHPVLSRILNGKSLGDVYQLGMSMVDSAAIAGLAAAGIPGGTALLGGSAASQGVLDALEAGANDSQALTMGILNGTFEMLFEEVSLEKLLKGNATGIIKSILQQGAVEGSEEFFTTLANNVADILVMGEKSDLQTRIASYMLDGGMDEKTATITALEDITIGMGWDFLGGMITGGIMETAAKPIRNYAYGGTKIEKDGLAADRLAELENSSLPANGSQAGSAEIMEERAAPVDGEIGTNNTAQNDPESMGNNVFHVSKNSEKGTTEISFSEKPSKEIQDVLKKNGFKWSKKNRLWYGEKSIEQAESIVREAMGISESDSDSGDRAMSDSSSPGTARIEPEAGENDSVLPDGEPEAATKDVMPDDKPFDVSWIEGKTLLNREDGSTVETRISGIASNERGKLMLNVVGQSEPVSADKISYADYGDAILYQSINTMDIAPGAAKEFVAQANEMGDKKAEFVFEVKNMYTLGELGVPLVKAVKSGYADNISSVMQEFGWLLGRRVYDEQVQKAESNKKANAAAQKASASVSGQNVNGVKYDGLAVKRGSGGGVEIEGVTLNEQQKAGIRAAEMLAQIGVNIHVFQSQTDSSGKPIGENGSYSTRNGSIHIDLNAGNMGQGVMAYTLSHELTHFMEQQSPAKFQAFTDALFAELDTDVEAEIENKAEELKLQHPEQYKNASRETLLWDARSEVVAEACETMLTDTDAAQRIGQSLKAKDATLFEKAVQWFRDLAAKLREAYKDLRPDSQIANEAKKTIQQVDSLVQMWADMTVDAAENYRTAAGDTTTGNTADAGGVKMQARDGDASRPYSYDSLVSKPDIAVTTVDNKFPNSRADVVYYAKKNASKIGKFNTKDGSVSVHVKDIDTDVLLTTAGLRHGLDRRFNVNAPVTLKIGEILQNSIRINEMNPSKETASESYALIGAAATADGQLYVVRSVVNRFRNEISSVDVLYAVNSKSDANKKRNRAGDNPQGSRRDSRFLTDSTISISELLDYVNEYFPDITTIA